MKKSNALLKQILIAGAALLSAQVSSATDIALNTTSYTGGLPYGYAADTEYNWPAINGVRDCKVEVRKATTAFPWQNRITIEVHSLDAPIFDLTSIQIDPDEMNKALTETGHFETDPNANCSRHLKVTHIKTATQDVLSFNIDVTACDQSSHRTGGFQSIGGLPSSCQILPGNANSAPQYDMSVAAPNLPTLL